MSSNLTVSYSTQTATGPAPAGVSAVADAASADGPLGFFAALIDQLLDGITTTSDDKPTDQSDTAASTLPLSYVPPPAAPVVPQTGSDLLADLTTQLDALQAQLAQGQTPSPDQLAKLDATFAALSTALAVTTTTQPTAGAPTDDETAKLLASLGITTDARPSLAQPVADAREHLLALSQSLAATAPALAMKLDDLATQLADLGASPDRLAQFTGQPPDDDLPAVNAIIRALLGGAPTQADASATDAKGTSPHGDELLQILASLGISTAAPSAQSSATATPADTNTVPPALLRISNQLSAVATQLAATAPDLSARLEAVATKLVAVDADPKLFAELSAAAADPDGAALDKLVRSLIDSKSTPALPTAPPQIATTARLDIPAPLLPDPSKSAVAEVKAAQPQTAPVTADSATDSPTPRLEITRTADRAPDPDATPPKPEAKATAIAAETAKSDPAQAGAPQQVPTATTPLVAAANARALPAAYQSAANPINMGQVAFEMARQIHQGTSRFTVRLDPPELGRVDVRMHVDQQGAVTARLTVDRAETLDMFQRDQRQLERALAQAGLDSARTSLEFSLRQNNSGSSFNDQRQQQNFAGNSRFSPGGSGEQASSIPAITLYRGTASAGGVNIFA